MNKFGVAVRRGCNDTDESDVAEKGENKNPRNKKNSSSLFNMINCEIVKVDGINKHENDCEQCQEDFLCRISREYFERKMRAGGSIFVDIWLIVPNYSINCEPSN